MSEHSRPLCSLFELFQAAWIEASRARKKKCFWRRFKEERKKGMRGILLCVVIPWTNPSLVVRDDLSWAEHCTQMGGTFFVHLSPHNWTQLATGVSFFQSWALVRRLTSCWERLSLLLFSYSLYFRRVYSTGYAQWVHVCVCVTFDQLSTAHSPYTHTHPSTVDHPLSHSDGRFFYNKPSQRTRTSWRSVGRSVASPSYAIASPFDSFMHQPFSSEKDRTSF